MASLVVAGDTSGSVTLSAPSVSGSTVLTLPTTTGTLVVTGGAQTIEFADGSAAAPSITNSGDTNTGIFFSAADTIDFAEGGTACGQFDSSANFKFNSGFGSVATAYGCRAWVNFNGTGTVAIRASGNVTSVTDVGTGQYTINLTNAMPDANFATTVGYSRSYAGFDTADANRILTVVATTTTSVSIQTTTPPTTLADLAYIGVAVLR